MDCCARSLRRVHSYADVSTLCSLITCLTGREEPENGGDKERESDVERERWVCVCGVCAEEERETHMSRKADSLLLLTAGRADFANAIDV